MDNSAVKSWSWKQAPELMSRLKDAQNSDALEHQDVMTFAGMCGSEAELLRHVEFCEKRANGQSWVSALREQVHQL